MLQLSRFQIKKTHQNQANTNLNKKIAEYYVNCN